MSTLSQRVVTLAKDRSFTLQTTDYIYDRILVKTPKFVVYDIQSKAKPIYTIPEEKFEEEWVHSTVLRLTKLPDNDEQIKALFDEFQVRKEINYSGCPDIIPFHDQGLVQFGDNVYHATRYDDPCRNFEHFVTVDHQGLELEALDAFRIARGPLEAFKYLKANGFVLTQFDADNFFLGSFSEDRGNYARVLFKGHKNQSAPAPSLEKRHKFSPPETQSNDIYKSYSFSVGLMVIYAILNTNNKGGEFPNNLYQDTSKLAGLIQSAVNTLYKENKDKAQHKELFKVFLEDLLEVNVDKRRSPDELLKYKWISECAKADLEEYKKELEENEKAKQKEKEEEEKNKFN